MVHVLLALRKLVHAPLVAGKLGTLAGWGGTALVAVLTIASSGQAFAQVPALSARLLGPIAGVAADANGNVFAALPNANIVVRVDPAGILTVAAGTGTQGNSGDNGPATMAQLNSPTGVAIGPAGTLYVAESESLSVGLGSQIRMVSNGVITTVAGGGSDFESDNIPATSASLSILYGNSFVVDPAGNLFMVSFGRIRKVSNGLITTVLNGALQNPPASAQNIALDAAGAIYFTNQCEARVYKLSSGLLTTFAGSGTASFLSCVPAASTGDGGPATSASLYMPSAITIDGTGAVYVMEQNPSGDRVRRISNGIITAFAGGGPNVVPTFTNDNIPATSAFLLNSSADIAADPTGNLYIGDQYFTTATGRIREVSGGIINTVAGAQGSVCPSDYLVKVSPALFQASGGNSNATFAISADVSCGWTVAGLPAWITLAGPGSGTGPASVQLNVLADPGGERSATFQVAGVFVTVTQASCAYSLNASGQAFPAQGGNGTVTITTGAGCPWTAGTPPAGVTFTSPPAGTGSGSVSYQVLPNSGGAASAAFTIAGQPFTIEQQAASIPGLNLVGSMPHLAAEENWTTTFTLVNKGTSAATARLSLFGDPGDASGNGPLTLPLTFPQQPSGAGPLLASSFDRTLAANASLIIATAGPQTPPVQVGSAQLAATDVVDGFAIFHLIPGAQEAVVPMETRNASSYLLAYDNIGGVVLAAAVANVSAQAANIGIVVRDDTGTVIGTPGATIALGANGHTAFVLPIQFPATANKRGTIEFDTPVGGQISMLGIRTTPLTSTTNTLTTIPALANVGTGGGSFAFLASGGDGWQTTFVLVNAGSSAAPATLKFFDPIGNPLSLPLSYPQSGSGAVTQAPSVTQTIAAGATLVVQTGGVPTLLTGSAQLTTLGNISGFVVFRFNPTGQEAVVPIESRNAAAYLLPFDNTSSTATGISVNNVAAPATFASPNVGPINTIAPQTVVIPVVVRDDMGNLLAQHTLTMAANGEFSGDLAQQSATLGTVLFPETANIRGTLEFDAPTGAQIGVIGIRTPPTNTYTTLPALMK